MAWTSKKIFKVTPTIGSTATWIQDITQAPTPAPAEPVSPTGIEDIQGQIDDIVDSIENEYAIDYVFDQFDYFISTHPFYFHWEIPLGTVEIVSARVSFEVKDYRNENLTDSRYAITGDSTDRPVITFYVSEDKGCLFGDAYGPYSTDMRAIDISGDLTGEGIKIIKFKTDVDVCVTARVFLRVKINKDQTPDALLNTLLERPEVKTLAATSILDVSATLNGDIISVGKGSYTDRTTGEIVPVTCTKRGFKYGLTKTDTWDTSESATYVKGTYGISVTGLTPETDYYFKAYAENQVGRSYGEYMKVTTIAAIPKIFVVYDNGTTYYIKSYNVDGTLVDTWTIETTENIGNPIAVDVNTNVYTITGNQHSIKKRNSSGILVLTKTETNYIYNIVAGSDGYIYTQEYDAAFNNGYLSKRRASDLVSVDTKSLGSIDTYYGMTIDSDGDFYLMNDGDSKYERWDWTDGLVSSVTALHTTFNSLGVVDTKIADVHWLSHALHRAKDLSGGETDVELTDLTSPGAVGNTNTHFLFAGYNGSGIVTIGKYDTDLTKVWTVTVSSSANYGGVAAYPF